MAERTNNRGGSHASHQAPTARELREQQKERERHREAAARAAEKARKEAERAEREEQRHLKAARARARRRRIWRTVKIVLIVVLVVTALAAVGLTYAAYRVTGSDTNLPGVRFKGIDVGGLTQQQTLDKLGAAGWDKEASEELTVELPAGVSFSLNWLEAGAILPKEEAAEAAFAYGHGEDWFDNLYRYVQGYLRGADLGRDELTLNEEYIRGQIAKGLKQFEKKNVEQGYEVDREKAVLSLVKGAGHMKINEEKLTAAVYDALKNGETTLDYKHIDNELPMPDFEQIHDELAVEPQDAHWIEGTFEVEPEVVGCKFDVEDAKKRWEAAGLMETVKIPLEITEPEVTAESLEGLLFRDCLGAQTTYYTSSSDARVGNINLAVSKINGFILMPGETFSYNGTVGQRTEEAGFQEAPAYSDGQVVQEVGGGICQVSSTLYCATMYAQMETVSRTSHYFRVNYLPIGQDATVSWPGPDFKFKNNREYPVKIVAWCDNDERALTIELWGTDVDGSYVELVYEQYVVFDSEYTWVVVGSAAQVWRNVYDKDGNFLYSVKEPYSDYHKHEEDIQWPPEKYGNTGGNSGGEESGGDGEPAIIVDG